MLKPNELTNAAIHFKLNPKTFIVMKSSNPHKFKYIHDFDPEDFISAWGKYLDSKLSIQNRVETMYYTLKENNKLFEFGRYLEDQGIYVGRSFAVGVKYALFTSSNGINYHPTLLKFKRILELYDNYEVN